MAWSRLWRSLPRSNISRSKTLIISYDRSIEALNLLPSRCQRLIRSTSALRRRCFVSILSQSLHFWLTGTVCMMSFIPQVSPVRYSLLQCCRKCPHFQSPQANRCWSKKHMFGVLFSVIQSLAIFQGKNGLSHTKINMLIYKSIGWLVQSRSLLVFYYQC